MKYTVDARGKQCPIPVVETKKVLAQMTEKDEVETLVDNEIAVQNLEKMARQKQLPFRYETLNGHTFRAVITGGSLEGAEEQETECKECMPCQIPATGLKETVVVLSSDKMGEGDETLGKALMKGFVYALASQEALPSAVIMYNGGAKLSVEGSDSLEDLRLLESQGVEILTCGTCLNHYGLTEKLAVGNVTNMYVICEKMMQAGKVVKP